ncbi:MAG: type II secretion system protein N [Pseudomonadota bacterium]
MLKRALWIAIPVFVIGLAARLPASVALSWFLPDTVETRGIQGTVWNGSVDAAAYNELGIGPVEWRLSPFALLTGRAKAKVEAKLPGGFFDGTVTASPSGRMVVQDARAQVDLGTVTRNASMGPSRGTARVSADRLEIDQQWPVAVEQGVLELRDLTYLGIGTQPLGSHRITFSESEGDTEFPIIGVIESLEGAFDVDATLRLATDSGYQLTGSVGLTEQAPPRLRQQLSVALGQPDATGRFQLDERGSVLAP